MRVAKGASRADLSQVRRGIIASIFRTKSAYSFFYTQSKPPLLCRLLLSVESDFYLLWHCISRFATLELMKPYAQYTVNELAADDLFIRWVQHPEDDEVAAYWMGLEMQQPQLRIRFRDARQRVLEIGRSITLNNLRPDEMATVWGRIRGSLQDLEDVRPLRPEVRSFIGWWYFARSIAATIVIVCLVGWTVYKQYSQEASRLITTTTQARRIALPDGSVVTLLPHSQLRYTPRGFARESASEGSATAELTRAVWLDGAADFVVARPTASGVSNAFRVHTENLTAEATGTRFRVSHQEGETRVLLHDGELDLLVGHRQVRHLSPGESVLVAGGDLQTE